MANLQNSDQVCLVSSDGKPYKMAFSDFRTSLDTYYPNVSNNNTYTGTSTFNGLVTYGADSGQILTATATLTAATIVGNTAGTLGHASGVTVVPAPGAGKTIQFISAVLIYDFATAAYTAGDDTMILLYPGFNTLSGAITKASLLGAAGDKIVALYPLTTAGVPMVVNTGLALAITTAFTQPGTAAGVCRVSVNYRILTTNL